MPSDMVCSGTLGERGKKGRNAQMRPEEKEEKKKEEAGEREMIYIAFERY